MNAKHTTHLRGFSPSTPTDVFFPDVRRAWRQNGAAVRHWDRLTTAPSWTTLGARPLFGCRP